MAAEKKMEEKELELLRYLAEVDPNPIEEDYQHQLKEKRERRGERNEGRT